MKQTIPVLAAVLKTEVYYIYSSGQAKIFSDKLDHLKEALEQISQLISEFEKEEVDHEMPQMNWCPS